MEAESLKMKALGNAVSGMASISTVYTVPSHCVFIRQRDYVFLWDLFSKGTNPIGEDPVRWSSHCPGARSSNDITLGIRFSMQGFQGHKTRPGQQRTMKTKCCKTQLQSNLTHLGDKIDFVGVRNAPLLGTLTLSKFLHQFEHFIITLIDEAQDFKILPLHTLWELNKNQYKLYSAILL